MNLEEEGKTKTKAIFKENVQQNRIVSPPNKKQKAQSEYKRKARNDENRKLIDDLKIQCNKEEFKLMQEEEKEEKEREELQKTAENINQLRRLQKIHAVQRARFQEKLNKVMKENQKKIKKFQDEL